MVKELIIEGSVFLVFAVIVTLIEISAAKD